MAPIRLLAPFYVRRISGRPNNRQKSADGCKINRNAPNTTLQRPFWWASSHCHLTSSCNWNRILLDLNLPLNALNQKQASKIKKIELLQCTTLFQCAHHSTGHKNKRGRRCHSPSSEVTRPHTESNGAHLMNSGFSTATSSYHTPQFTLRLELKTKGAVMLMMKVGDGRNFLQLSVLRVRVRVNDVKRESGRGGDK